MAPTPPDAAMINPWLAGIFADPASDELRLRHADWLADQGGVPGIDQAEFIRLQLVLERLPENDPSRLLLMERERNLLGRHWPLWIRPLCQALGEPLPIPPVITADSTVTRHLREQGVRHYHLNFAPAPERRHTIQCALSRSVATEPRFLDRMTFRRGFVESVALRHMLSRSPVYLARLFERTPIADLSLSLFPIDFIREMLVQNLFAKLTGLTLIFDDPEIVRLVANSPQAVALQSLALHMEAPGDGSIAVGMIARTNALERLERLTLAIHPLPAGRLELLLVSRVGERLRELNLLFQPSDAQVASLTRIGELPRLERLTMVAPPPHRRDLFDRLVRHFGTRIRLVRPGE